MFPRFIFLQFKLIAGQILVLSLRWLNTSCDSHNPVIHTYTQVITTSFHWVRLCSHTVISTTLKLNTRIFSAVIWKWKSLFNDWWNVLTQKVRLPSFVMKSTCPPASVLWLVCSFSLVLRSHSSTTVNQLTKHSDPPTLPFFSSWCCLLAGVGLQLWWFTVWQCKSSLVLLTSLG